MLSVRRRFPYLLPFQTYSYHRASPTTMLKQTRALDRYKILLLLLLFLFLLLLLLQSVADMMRVHLSVHLNHQSAADCVMKIIAEHIPEVSRLLSFTLCVCDILTA